MSKTFHQHKLIFFFGCIVVPFVLFGALFYYRANNVTELLMNVGTSAYITTFILLAWLVYLLYQEGKNIQKGLLRQDSNNDIFKVTRLRQLFSQDYLKYTILLLIISQ